MRREHIQRWSLALIALFMLPTAIQAGLVVSLPSIPVLAVLSLWAGLRPGIAG